MAYGGATKLYVGRSDVNRCDVCGEWTHTIFINGTAAIFEYPQGKSGWRGIGTTHNPQTLDYTLAELDLYVCAKCLASQPPAW
jgi:uncharacterized protein (UPF0212 family)